MTTLTEKFVMELARIKQPEVFLGVARILKVELLDGEEPREFELLWTDMIDKYEESNRKRKRELLKILRDANGN